MTKSAIKKAIALYLGDRDRYGRKIDEEKTGIDEAYHLEMQVGRETLFFPSGMSPAPLSPSNRKERT